jgi:hypothetical protein
MTSDESLETPSISLESNPEDSPDKRVPGLLASQARARAARPSQFALSDSLWTLKECPSPKPSQLGEEQGAAILSDVPRDVLCDSPSPIHSSTAPQEGHSPETPHDALKRTRSSHCISLLHRKGSHTPSLPLAGLSRCKSSSSPHLREAAARSQNGSPGGDRNHRQTSVSGHSASYSQMSNIAWCLTLTFHHYQCGRF